MKALLFGSIGTLVDSSHLQLDAYNEAFAEAGLDWTWSRAAYERMLHRAGGQARLKRYAAEHASAEPSDELVERIHRRKSELFQQRLNALQDAARPGVRRLLNEAQAAGVRTGFVTSTEIGNVRATVAAAGDAVRLDRFDVLTHRENVPAEKPDPAPWHFALEQLGLEPHEAVAIEDTGACVDSAVDAGLFTVATPNAFAGGQDFRRAHAIVDCLGDTSQAARPLAGQNIIADNVVTLERLARALREATSASAGLALS